ncbi:hypothetical protein [Pseudomonas sp. A-RE-26]|uniref:hypothetical protein n=1 Tax=Pseudomonas sp. A-RE-26 TaxID=2832402 RepID=UPI001CBE9C10|nr:hypothetical protein [Pseudomonas sp. A-RE-26]
MTLSKHFMQRCSVFLGQLARPFSYLAIKHDYKYLVDWVFPAVLVVITGVVLFFLRQDLNVFGDSGILSRVLGFIQNLPGFYIAALAAIATFGRSDIDNIIPTPTPMIMEVREGEENRIPLTRRRFLCMMFSFLTAECVVLILVSIGLLSFAGDYQGRPIEGFKVFTGIGFLIYMLFFYQMVLATFWGLFYLGDKIHQTD